MTRPVSCHLGRGLFFFLAGKEEGDEVSRKSRGLSIAIPLSKGPAMFVGSAAMMSPPESGSRA